MGEGKLSSLPTHLIFLTLFLPPSKMNPGGMSLSLSTHTHAHTRARGKREALREGEEGELAGNEVVADVE